MDLLIDAGVSKERKRLFMDALKDSGLGVFFVGDASLGEMEGCEILLQSFTATEKVAENVARSKKLRMLQTISAGVDGLPFSAIPPDIMICSNAGAFSEPIAEHTFSMILGLAKRLKPNEAKMREGTFDQETRTQKLSGKVLGVLGYGGIGRAVASVGRCFGMKIYGISRNHSHSAECDFHGGLENIDDMLSSSDVVVISIPLNSATKGLIDRRKLSIMKENAILVNVARGQIVVESDLYEHLTKHRNFSAGIDAWWKEPRHGEKFSGNLDFLSLPNVIGSPHNSGIVDGMTAHIVGTAIANIKRFAAGEMPLNIVRREDYI